MNSEFRLLPDQGSTMATRVDALFWFVLAIAAFFTVLIGVLVIAFAIRYRRRGDDYFPSPVVGSKALEITWTVIPLGLAMIIFFWGASVFFDIFRPPDNALEVYVTGRQWMWHLEHPGGQREINTLHVPMGRPVKLIMTSEDVIHSFYVPAFRVKMDVLPGKYTYTWFEPTKAGEYRLFCAEYCGTNHSRMIGRVVVLEPAEYERWLYERADRSMALQGRQLFQKLQCVTCHNTEANNRAPNLEGLFGKRVALEDGRTVLADEAYIRESILYPARKVRAGWRPIMPSFKAEFTRPDGTIDEQQLVHLIAFVKSLGPGDLPSRVEESSPPALETKEEKKAEKDKDKKK
jgi:cytochrome c oxidase subunit 2